MLPHMKIKYLLLLFLPLLLFSGCYSPRNLTYLRNIDKTDTLWKKNKPDYHLQSNDILYIRIVSSTKEINTLYNPLMGESGTSGNASTQGGMYLYGYNISDSGTVKVPLIGVYKVAGLTLEETGGLLQHEVDKYLKNAMVIVKLAEFRVVFLGEVARPGRRTFQTGQLTIFDAIAEAGDITPFGRRRDVVVIRQEEKGVRSYSLDLTDPQLASSPGYYVMPNDIIYVKPRFIHGIRNNLGEYFLVLGSIGTTIATIILLTKLKL